MDQRNFSDEGPTPKYPAHGVALNRDGLPLLWLPILTLIQSYGSSKRLDPPVNAGMANACSQLLSRIVIATREMAELEASVSWITDSFADEAREPSHRAFEMYPLFYEYAVFGLKRFADDLARTIRPLLFLHPASAPGGGGFRKLRTAFLPGDTLHDVELRVDSAGMRDLFTERTGWFDYLAQHATQGDHELGIRTRLEHRTTHIQAFGRISGDQGMRLEIGYYQPGQPPQQATLSYELKDNIAQMCDFLSDLHRAIGRGDDYTEMDCHIIPGHGEAATSYWPRIDLTDEDR
ncbi:MAG: hypothetical protein O7C01_12110 [Actinobacteria bacterium]|nr:hypothetical protein [Actinomycetota bacterium]